MRLSLLLWHSGLNFQVNPLSRNVGTLSETPRRLIQYQVRKVEQLEYERTLTITSNKLNCRCGDCLPNAEYKHKEDAHRMGSTPKIVRSREIQAHASSIRSSLTEARPNRLVTRSRRQRLPLGAVGI
jgi:hypothetical protein